MRPDPSPSSRFRLRCPRPVIAIVGAAGAVGNELLRILDQRRFPGAELRLLASPRSAGRRLAFADEELPVEVATETALDGVDFALFSAGSDTARRWAPQAVRAGPS
jgi:aspartate-semialdehyde dehydrogenase